VPRGGLGLPERGPARGRPGCAASPRWSSDPTPSCPSGWERRARSTSRQARRSRWRPARSGRTRHAGSAPRARRFPSTHHNDRSLLDVAVSVGRAGHHRLRAAARAVQLPASGALGDLRALVLGDHALELAQELVPGRAAALGLLREAHVHTDAREFLEQQHLVGIATREPVRGVTEQPPRTPPRRRGRSDARAPAAAASRRITPRLRTRDPPGSAACARRRAHAARRSGLRSSRPVAGARRTPARRSLPPCPPARPP
jgi:hypothetical protein